MEKHAKKFIAREGLILLGVLLMSLVIIFVFLTTEFTIAGEQLSQRVVTGIVIFLLLGYPVYSLIRFIKWAIKTLKEE